MSGKPSETFKITVLGLDGVGKSSLVSQFVQNQFDNKIDPLYENIYQSKANDKKSTIIEIYDTSSDKPPSESKTKFMRASRCFIIVFAVDDKSSFETVSSFLKDVKTCENKYSFTIICGNKTDTDDRQITRFEALKYCCNKNIIYYEISAKSNQDVQDFFNKMIKMIEDISTNILSNFN